MIVEGWGLQTAASRTMDNVLGMNLGQRLLVFFCHKDDNVTTLLNAVPLKSSNFLSAFILLSFTKKLIFRRNTFPFQRNASFVTEQAPSLLASNKWRRLRSDQGGGKTDQTPPPATPRYTTTD